MAQGMGTGALFLSFLPSQKAILKGTWLVWLEQLLTCSSFGYRLSEERWTEPFSRTPGPFPTRWPAQALVWVQAAPVTPLAAASRGRCQPGAVPGLVGHSGPMSRTGSRQRSSRGTRPPLCCPGRRPLHCAGRKWLKLAPAVHDLFAPVLRLLFTCALSLFCYSQRGESTWIVVAAVALLFSSSGYPL